MRPPCSRHRINKDLLQEVEHHSLLQATASRWPTACNQSADHKLFPQIRASAAANADNGLSSSAAQVASDTTYRCSETNLTGPLGVLEYDCDSNEELKDVSIDRTTGHDEVDDGVQVPAEAAPKQFADDKLSQSEPERARG